MSTYRRLVAVTALLLLAATPTFAATKGGKGSKTTKKRAVTTAPAPTTAAPKVEKVNIAVDGFTLGSLVYVGMEKGTFAAQNIEAKPVPFQTGFAGLAALSSGQVDFAVGLDFAVVSSMSPNLAVVGTIASPLPGFHRLVLRQEISGSRDLFGKKVGVVTGTSQDYVTQRWLEVNGLAGNVDMVPLPGPFEMLAALKTNQIQGAFLYTTSLTAAADDTNLKLMGDDSEVLKTQGIYLVTSAKTARENPELVKRVLLAEDRAAQFIKTDPEGSAKIIAKGVKGDVPSIIASLKVTRFGIGFSAVQRDVLLGIQKYLIGQKKIPSNSDITKSLVLDPLREAIPGRVGF